MSKTLRVACIALLIAATAEPPPVHAETAEDTAEYRSCTPQTCAGLHSFESIGNFLEQIDIDSRAAHLAFRIGLSLVREDCCFATAVAYLVFALRTDPPLEPVFYDAMNEVVEDPSGRYTRAILAVSSRLRKLPIPGPG